jgi:hypothetical protein
MSKYANRKRLKGPTFERGDKVYLLRRNIKIRRLSDKLDYKKLRPFKIKNVISEVNYELDLLSTMKIYLVFYISLLELVSADTELRELVKINLVEGEYEVEVILSYRKKGRTI